MHSERFEEKSHEWDGPQSGDGLTNVKELFGRRYYKTDTIPNTSRRGRKVNKSTNKYAIHLNMLHE